MNESAFKNAEKRYEAAKAANRLTKIDIPDVVLKEVSTWADEMVKAKMSEDHRKRDPNSMKKREITGKLAEWAIIERFLGIPGKVDMSIGYSKDYAVADLGDAGYNLGVKAVSEENIAPLVPLSPKGAELIALYSEKDKAVYIAGIATRAIITKYVDRNLVKDPNVRFKGGFGRYDKLLPPTEMWMNVFKKSTT